MQTWESARGPPVIHQISEVQLLAGPAQYFLDMSPVAGLPGWYEHVTCDMAVPCVSHCVMQSSESKAILTTTRQLTH